jgi:hypothetical protein
MTNQNTTPISITSEDLMAEVENLLKEQQLTTAKPIEPASQKQEEEQNVGQNVGQDVEQKEEKIVVKS